MGETKKVLLGKDLHHWLIAAGVYGAGDPIRRVVIDIHLGEVRPVVIYIEKYGATQILDVGPPDMAGAVIKVLD